MTYIFGIVISFISIFISLKFLNQSFIQYFDDVALAVVVGGTFGVAMITLPWDHFREIVQCLGGLFYTRNANDKSLVSDSLQFIGAVTSGKTPQITAKGLAGRVLRDGWELLELRFSEEDIEAILQERVHQSTERTRAVGLAFKGLAKYPPAFGLVGTVFGLVNLMRAITEGLDPRQTGVRMAIALVATLYGLLLANMVIAPIGERINKNAESQRQRGELAVQAVLLAAGRVSMLKAQEMLNSYVTVGRRVNFIKTVVNRDEKELDAA